MALAAAPITPSSPYGANSVYDFMVMSVCVDSGDRIVAGLTPMDSACRHTRKIRSGEPVPYHLSDFRQNHDCRTGGAPLTIHDNVPMTRNGVTRTVSAVSVDYDMCSDHPTETPAYYEVHWFDDQYGFMMGAWAREPAPNGHVGGAITPLCAQNVGTSHQYYRFWLIGPARVIDRGKVGHDLFSDHGYNSGLPPIDADCPSKFTPYLGLWTYDRFTFGPGGKPSYSLDTLISHPYSQANQAGTSPGDGEQDERTYWTKEFGQSRWEAWKRDDWVNKKSGKTALELAQETFQRGACTRPYEITGQVTSGMVLGGLHDDGTYNQTLTDLTTGVTHVWYMAECLDMTNLVVAKNPSGDPAPSGDSLRNDAFWKFWVEK